MAFPIVPLILVGAAVAYSRREPREPRDACGPHLPAPPVSEIQGAELQSAYAQSQAGQLDPFDARLYAFRLREAGYPRHADAVLHRQCDAAGKKTWERSSWCAPVDAPDPNWLSSAANSQQLTVGYLAAIVGHLDTPADYVSLAAELKHAGFGPHALAVVRSGCRYFGRAAFLGKTKQMGAPVRGRAGSDFTRRRRMGRAYYYRNGKRACCAKCARTNTACGGCRDGTCHH